MKKKEELEVNYVLFCWQDSKCVATFFDAARDGQLSNMEKMLQQNPGLILLVDDCKRSAGPFIRKGATALIYVTVCIRIVLFGCFVKLHAWNCSFRTGKNWPHTKPTYRLAGPKIQEFEWWQVYTYVFRKLVWVTVC